MHIPRRTSGGSRRDYILTYGLDWEVGLLGGNSRNTLAVSPLPGSLADIASVQKWLFNLNTLEYLNTLNTNLNTVYFDEDLRW